MACDYLAVDPDARCPLAGMNALSKCPVTCGFCKPCSQARRCLPECNNYACGHTACKPNEIRSKCIPETTALGDVSDVPTDDASPVPVGIGATFTEPIVISLDKQYNTIHATAGLSIDLQWEDPRLLTTVHGGSPCLPHAPPHH